MDINGCHIVSVINADFADGFAPTVSRYVGCRKIPNPVPEDAIKISRGPFLTIRAAIQYAQTWNDANEPPPMPVEPPKAEPAKIETASESVAVQIVPEAENPPIVELTTNT